MKDLGPGARVTLFGGARSVCDASKCDKCWLMLLNNVCASHCKGQELRSCISRAPSLALADADTVARAHPAAHAHPFFFTQTGAASYHVNF